MSIPFKICGLTREEDVRLAQDLGAAFVGVIMVPRTPRCVTIAKAKRLFAVANLPKVLVVGDLPLTAVQDLIDELRPDVVQLHRNEPPAFANALRGAKIWRAFSLETQEDVAAAAAYPAEVIVADTGKGGTGRTGNWTLAKQLAQHRNVVIAGGITAENARDAYEATDAIAVDCCSGVEATPGIKKPEKLRAFAQTCRTV